MKLPVSEAIRTFFPRAIFGIASIWMTVGWLTPDPSRAATTSDRRDSSEKLCTTRELANCVRAGCWGYNSYSYFCLLINCGFYLGLRFYDDCIHHLRGWVYRSCFRSCPRPQFRLYHNTKLLHSPKTKLYTQFQAKSTWVMNALYLENVVMMRII